MSQLKVLPHSIEAEKAVIASLLLDINKFYDVYEIIHTHEAFYNPDYALCYQCIAELLNDGINPDDITISDRMASHKEKKEIANYENVILEIDEYLKNQIQS